MKIDVQNVPKDIITLTITVTSVNLFVKNVLAIIPVMYAKTLILKALTATVNKVIKKLVQPAKVINYIYIIFLF